MNSEMVINIGFAFTLLSVIVGSVVFIMRLESRLMVLTAEIKSLSENMNNKFSEVQKEITRLEVKQEDNSKSRERFQEEIASLKQSDRAQWVWIDELKKIKKI